MSTQFIKLSHNDRGVYTITLARPEKHNAFDDQIILQLHEIFNRLKTHSTARVVVLAAEGKSFSAGADLNWMRRVAAYNYEDNKRDARALADALEALNTLPQPTIARVQGAAYGGALGLISCCDMAYASANARFALSEVKLGIVPAVVSPYVLSAIGERAARRYFQTAEVFDAQRALDLGLLSAVVAEEKLDQEINQCVDRLLANGPVAMQEAKKLIFNVAHREIDERMLDYTSDVIASIRISEEGQEGLTAFLEKRQASWIRDDSNV